MEAGHLEASVRPGDHGDVAGGGMSPIIDIQKRLVEVGRIRMGVKEGGRPKKIETFRLTSRDQARLTEVAAQYGGEVRAWADRPGEFEVITAASELPILLLPGQALSQWWEHWSAGGAQRRCDGVTDVISDGPCVCDQEGDRKCKPTTRLSVMLPDIPGLGVWRLESHGYYAAVELAATAGMLEQATAQGQVFPARLRIDQRSQVKDGKTTRYAVPVIDIDVRLPEALGRGGQPVAAVAAESGALGHTPIAELPAGVTVGDALDATARQAEPKTRSGRAAEPIGAQADFITPEPVPVPDGDEPIEAEPAKPVAQPPANVEQKLTQPQAKKLNVLVGKLRDAGQIQTLHLWKALAKERSFELEQMIELLGGRDDDGELHWSPLRDSLTRSEATALIDRLSKLEEPVAA